MNLARTGIAIWLSNFLYWNAVNLGVMSLPALTSEANGMQHHRNKTCIVTDLNTATNDTVTLYKHFTAVK